VTPRRRRVAAAAAVAAATTAGLGARRRWRDAGATAAERAETYPGDELVAPPSTRTTLAVGIHAPAEEVWPWLVQMGQGRGGLYSYDWLENLFGLDVHSADRILPELQDLAVGDRVVLVRDGWLGVRGGYSLPVAAIDPGRSLVLRQRPPEHPWDAVWSFHVVPVSHERCRLVSRSTAARPRGVAGALGSAMTLLMEPVTLVMTRRMLRGIKDRAEREHRSSAARALLPTG
jgi:hypothetical protein